MNFDALIKSIADIHRQTHASATKAVNTALTMRNWLIGAHAFRNLNCMARIAPLMATHILTTTMCHWFTISKRSYVWLKQTKKQQKSSGWVSLLHSPSIFCIHH
ncbi:hypothetical protein M2447_002225 [Ereboglobus sp. PH5-10]|uniref:hypothetical protein n=1 Tax=Ereboglobus sp. PH5-10 TaxID=2940629 RepID=UPI002406AD72|nr:hypothetical protein [Ereboglobus sp. PH5-10]MDF9828112.1 hypothetical protein [Ereboglobus sp. PH5-10]